MCGSGRTARQHSAHVQPVASVAAVHGGGHALVLPSPNGSAISAVIQQGFVLTGCLRNAKAVARRAMALAAGGLVAVIPAGERWPNGSLRPAIEDLLGAGAIFRELKAVLSPEAEVAQAAFSACQNALAGIVRGSVSGLELIERGYPQDVEIALEINASTAAPLLQDGWYGGCGTASHCHTQTASLGWPPTRP